jgi:cation transport regulator ChaC
VTGPTWLFGYGSLIWRQDFPFLDARPAFVTGWERRFWQGSHDHRGVPDDPGRVVTLIRSSGRRCYGRAFLIEPDVFEHLDHREINGYRRYPVDLGLPQAQVPGVMYVADTDNPAFLGDAPIDAMVAQIRRCAGASGTNVEYVLELARALRALDETDPHVEDLAARLGTTPEGH